MVYTPLLGQSKADMVVDIDGVLTKVQVKKATWCKTGNWEQLQVRIQSTRSRGYSDGDFDLLVVTDGAGLFWHVPYEETVGRISLHLATSNPNPKTSSKDYDPAEWLTH